MRRADLIGDKVHHIEKSYCRLLFPLLKGRWLAWRIRSKRVVAYDRHDKPMLPTRGFVLINANAFHNCSLILRKTRNA